MKDITHVWLSACTKCAAAAATSHRCLHSVQPHHLSAQTNTPLLWTVDINTWLTVNSQNVCQKMSSLQAKMPLPTDDRSKTSQSDAPAAPGSGDLWVTAARPNIYNGYTCFLWSGVLWLYKRRLTFTLLQSGLTSLLSRLRQFILYINLCFLYAALNQQHCLQLIDKICWQWWFMYSRYAVY